MNKSLPLMLVGIVIAIVAFLWLAEDDASAPQSQAPEATGLRAAAGRDGGRLDTPTVDIVRDEASTSPEDAAWLDHPYAFTLDVRVIDRSGLPVRGHRLKLGPVDGPLNESEHRTDADGRLQISWNARSPSGEIVLAERGGLLRRVPLQHGRPTTLTLLGRNRGRGQWAFTSVRLTFTGNGSNDLVFAGFEQAPQMKLGRHPHAVFGVTANQPRQTSEPSGTRIHYGNMIGEAVLINALGGAQKSDAAAAEQPPHPRITGTVFGADGKTAAKVQVALLGSGTQPLATTTTDDDGVFAFEEVKVGDFTVRAGGDAEGLATTTATTGTTPVSLHLTRGSIISGRVESEEGKPVAKARVTFIADDASYRDETDTDDAGRFTFANMPGNPGTLTVRDPQGKRPFPIASAAGVLCNTADLVLRVAAADGAIELEPVLPDGLGGQPTIRVWSEEFGVATTMPARGRNADGGAPIWRQRGLAAGWFRVELIHPAYGLIDAGRHWVDGTSTCKLGRIVMPEHARARLDFEDTNATAPAEAPAGTTPGDTGKASTPTAETFSFDLGSLGRVINTSDQGRESPFELYRLRSDFDVRVEARDPGEEMQLPPGDYAAFWTDTDETTRTRRFTAAPGKLAVIRMAR